MLEMIPSEGDAVQTGLKTPGIRHLAIAVDDIEAGVADLAAKGIEVSNGSQRETTGWRSSAIPTGISCT